MRVLKEDKTTDILIFALLISVVEEDRRFPHAVQGLFLIISLKLKNQ